MSSIAPQMGFAAKAYFLSSGTRASWGTVGANGAASAAAPPNNLTLISNCRDLKFSLKPGKSDVSIRGGAGFKYYAANLFDLSDMKLEQVYDPTDAGFQALLTAAMTRTTIALALMDNVDTTNGVYGIWADFMVEGFEKSEMIEGVQMIDWPVAFGYTQVPPQVVTCT